MGQSTGGGSTPDASHSSPRATNGATPRRCTPAGVRAGQETATFSWPAAMTWNTCRSHATPPLPFGDGRVRCGQSAGNRRQSRDGVYAGCASRAGMYRAGRSASDASGTAAETPCRIRRVRQGSGSPPAAPPPTVSHRRQTDRAPGASSTGQNCRAPGSSKPARQLLIVGRRWESYYRLLEHCSSTFVIETQSGSAPWSTVSFYAWTCTMVHLAELCRTKET